LEKANRLQECCIDIVTDNGQAGHEVYGSGGLSGLLHEYDIKPERLNDPVIYESRNYQQDTVRDASDCQLKIHRPHYLTSSLLIEQNLPFQNTTSHKSIKGHYRALPSLKAQYGHGKKKAWGRIFLPHAR
jgi:hypothetical protein